MSLKKQQKLAGTPIQQVYFGFLRYIKRFTPATQRAYISTLARFIDAMPPIYEQITMEHIEKFIPVNRKNSTKNCILYRIFSFCGYAENYLNLSNPAAKIKPFKVHFYEQRCITDEEYEKILAVCKPIEAAVVRFLSCSGLRRSEWQSLSNANISPDKTYLNIIGKGNRKRVVPLNQVCRDLLSTFNLTKSYKKNNSLTSLCRKLSRKSGIKVNPHAFRHFFATRMIRAGVPIAKLSKILGHKSIATTEIVYLHLLPSDTLGCTDCLDF